MKEESKVKTAEITTEALEKVFSFIKSIGASIVFEDPYDYSAGVKGAEPDYTPETIEELAYELGVVICDQSHITKLEARNKALEEALRHMLNYPVITIESISNYADGYNDALKEMRRLAEQVLNKK